MRFHLHPDVTAARDGQGVRLTTPDGGRWRFIAFGGPVALEDSVYFGRSDEPLPCRQIVIADALNGRGAVVKWALHRDEDG